MRYRSVAAAAMLIAAAWPSFAADTNTATPRTACATDVKTLCPTVQPGGGRIAQCMRSNADKLSSACREALQAARASKAAK